MAKGNGAIKIEHGIEQPKHGNAKYPWAEMEVGHSFYIKGGSYPGIWSSAKCNAARTGRKYAVRKVEGGIRVWRIA